MAMHIADHLVGAGHIHLDGGEPLWPFEPLPEAPPHSVPEPAAEPDAAHEAPADWLQQLPPPSTWHADFAPAAPEWGGPLADSPLWALPAPELAVGLADPAPATETPADATWHTQASLHHADPASLAADHGELGHLDLNDHAVHAGPPPAGPAMGSTEQLGMTDLLLADPLMREIAQSFGRTPEAPRTALAWEQVRLYCAARYEQMTRLHIGMESVRDQYSAALDRASQTADGPGWVDVAVQREVTTHSVQGDGDIVERHTLTTTERRFDPDAFTRWYNAQDGLANRAFAQLYGNSRTEYQTPWRQRGEDVPRSGPPMVLRVHFDNPAWHIAGMGEPMRRDDLVGIDLNTVPRLRNDAAVGFDFEVGWATSHDNFHHSPNPLRQVAQVAAVATVGYFTFGAVSAWAGASSGLGLGVGSTASIVVGSAAAGAASSFVGGALNGNVSLKGVLQGALSGALSAGLMSELGSLSAVRSAGAAGQIALRTTVQGGVQALLGGEFKDGAAAGFASGLAQAAGAALERGIGEAAANNTLAGAEVGAARTVARLVTSAIRALGNPDDPLAAFAGGFLQDVLQDSGLATAPVLPTSAARPVVAFDDEGNLMPGVVDTRAPVLQQAAQLAAALEGQGFSAEAAAQRAVAAVAQQLQGLAGTGLAAGPAGGIAGSALVQDDSGAGDASTRIVITGRALPRDEFGNRYDTDAQGRTLVLVAGGGVLALPAGTALPLPTGSGGLVQLGAATLRLLAGLATTAAQALPELTLRGAAGAVGGLLLPGNIGQGPQVLELSDGLRFEQRPGEVYGRLLEREPGTGQWELLRSDVRAVPTAHGFAVMSDAELTRWRAPLTTPAAPQPPSTWPLPAWADRPEVVPPYRAEGPAGPQTTTTPAQPVQDWRDLLIDKTNSGILGDNLRAAGTSPPGEGYEAHHIVPARAGDARMQALRQRLVGLGLDLNQAANGVWLPGHSAAADAPGAYHPRLANDVYHDAVISAFRGVNTLERAHEVLADIGARLLQGGSSFPGIRPRGG